MGRAWKTVLGLLVVVCAPLIAAWRDLTAERPVVALLIAAAWLAVVAVATLFWRMVGPSVGTRLEAGGTSLLAAVERRFSSYGRRYREWVRDRQVAVDLQGLSTIGAFTPELSDVFVGLDLVPRALNQVQTGVVARDTTTPADVRRERYDIRQLLNNRPRAVLAILGAPGSGKTTLLRQVARQVAENHQQLMRPVPVLLRLSEQAAAVVADRDVRLPDLIRGPAPAVEGEPPGWWEAQLRKGRCVVLLDGLDEVADDRTRGLVVRWINNQIAAYRHNDFVITSRRNGYDKAYLDSGRIFQVLPFDTADIRQFIRGWYRAVSQADAGVTAHQSAADELIGHLEASPALHDLATNPLLLTMIANVHLSGERLPDNRAALYREVCEVMIWGRDEAKGRDLAPPGPQRLVVLARLAYEWMRLRTRDARRRDLCETVRPWLSRFDHSIAAERFVTEMERAGLLQQFRTDRVGFVHQTFQEYLAAWHVAENGLADVLADVVNDPWWRETTLLYAATEESLEPIVAGALRSGRAPALSLAFEIAESYPDRVAPESHELLGRMLRGATRPEASALDRQLAVDVMAGRILRSMTVTARGARVAHAPVTAGLYQMFLDDTGTPAPDGWHPENADAVARGMWRSDTLAFLRWINARVAEGPRGVHGAQFRLPTTDDLGVLRPDWPAWAADRQILPVWHRAYRRDVVTRELLIRMLAPELRGTRLVASMMRRAVRDAAAQVRAATNEIGAGSGNLLRHVRTSPATSPAAAEATTAAAKSRLREIARGLELTAQRLDKAARDLVRALERWDERDPRLVKDLRTSLRTAVPDRARYELTVAEAEASGRHELKTSAVIKALDSARKTVDQALDLLDQAQVEVGPPMVVDDVLAPLRRLSLPLTPESLLSASPEAGVAESLVPEQLRREGTHLATNLDVAVGALRRLSSPAVRDQFGPGPYTQVLARVTAYAEPAITRRLPVTAETVAAVRVPALVLAQVAQHRGISRAGMDLIALAAAVYLLQERADRPEAREAIILASG